MDHDCYLCTLPLSPGQYIEVTTCGHTFHAVMIHDWKSYKPRGCILALCADVKDTILTYITSTSPYPYPPHPHRRPLRLRADGSEAEADRSRADGPTYGSRPMAHMGPIARPIWMGRRKVVNVYVRGWGGWG